jgi:hypothetical protein
MKTLKDKQRKAAVAIPTAQRPRRPRKGPRTMADIERMLRFIFDK